MWLLSDDTCFLKTLNTQRLPSAVGRLWATRLVFQDGDVPGLGEASPSCSRLLTCARPHGNSSRKRQSPAPGNVPRVLVIGNSHGMVPRAGLMPPGRGVQLGSLLAMLPMQFGGTCSANPRNTSSSGTAPRHLVEARRKHDSVCP